MSSIDAKVIRCPAGLIGDTGSGIITKQNIGIAGAVSTAIEYDVHWLSDVQWVRGGKLPGIYGGTVTGFGPTLLPNGTNGFTARPMFLADGGVSLYVWDMLAGPYGRGPKVAAGVFKPGARHRIRIGARLNTPGVADGLVTLDVDGQRLLSLGDFKARSTATMKITGCFFCVFYGGGDASYAPSEDQFITVTKVIPIK